VQRMDIAMVERLSRFCAGERRMQLLGGEPTLHPDIVTFLDILCRQHGRPDVFIVTNLMGPPAVVEKLLAHGRVDFLVNIHGSEYAKEPSLRERFKENVTLCAARRFQYTLGVTLFSPDQNFDYLYSFLRADTGRSVGALRMSPAVPTATGKHMLHAAVGEKWLELVKTVHRIRPEIRLIGDCPVANGCMFKPETYRQLAASVGQLSFVACEDLNYPFDILPDGSALYCFGTRGLPEATLPDVFAFPDIQRARLALSKRVSLWERSAELKRCDHAQCEFLGCRGWCPAVLHYKNPRATGLHNVSISFNPKTQRM
jgi:MoaA/NifB/PqqE/SkfB family radical SAM enzyme